VWSAEKRAEGLEYMHPKPSSHSGRIVGNPYLIALRQSCPSSIPNLTCAKTSEVQLTSCLKSPASAVSNAVTIA
jgi:hypothetical protein